jgi:hypothetical protein
VGASTVPAITPTPTIIGVQAICAACHPLTNITNSRGNSQEGWDALTKSMIALPPEVKTPMMEYLATHFPRKPGGEPVLVPGRVAVSIRESSCSACRFSCLQQPWR